MATVDELRTVWREHMTDVAKLARQSMEMQRVLAKRRDEQPLNVDALCEALHYADLAAMAFELALTLERGAWCAVVDESKAVYGEAMSADNEAVAAQRLGGR